MENYIKTIINGIKAWVEGFVSPVKAQVSKAQDTATKAQSTATAAQSTADKAQSTADKAQSTADKAQSTADKAQSTADIYSELFPTDQKHIHYSFDGDTTGKPTLTYDGFPYWKVSDLPPVIGRVVSGEAVYADRTYNRSIRHGVNVTAIGLAMVVFSSGRCKVALSENSSFTFTFEAPEPGIYLCWDDSSPKRQVETFIIDCKNIDCICNNSGSPVELISPSGARWQLAISDDGTLEAKTVNDTSKS